MNYYHPLEEPPSCTGHDAIESIVKKPSSNIRYVIDLDLVKAAEASLSFLISYMEQEEGTKLSFVVIGVPTVRT